MTRTRIRQLPSHIVNKIAAGEVIERPASVVKELVENSLDAGARRIEIDVESGGADLIRVRDDGEGIAREDLPLLFASHATSKLADPDELFHIVTLGFRGEALASIGSISRTTVRTRRRGDRHEGAEEGDGYELEHVTGEDGEVRVAASRSGTTIEVRHLFQNVPVRRKFLRSPSVELGHVTEAVTRAALAHPEVAFRLRHGSREVVRVEPASDLRQRIGQLFGSTLAGDLLPVRHEASSFRLDGWIAPPHHDRPKQDRMYAFLNGRFVKDRTLLHAMHEGFRGYLMNRRHPTVFLAITIDPGEVDVNVHPTKIEVRFRDGGPLHAAVRRSIRRALEGARTAPVPEPSGAGPGPVQAPDGPTDPSGRRDADEVRESIRDYLRTHAFPGGAARPAPGDDAPRRVDHGDVDHGDVVRGDVGRGDADRREAEQTETEGVTRTATTSEIGASEVPSVHGPESAKASHRDPRAASGLPGPGALDRADSSDASPPGERPVQIHGTYILRPTEDGFTLTDQHALHERILYHRILDRVREGGSLAVQRMLIPEVIELSASEVERLLGRRDELAALGFEVERFGEREVAVQSIPQVLRRLSPSDWVRQVLAYLESEEEGRGGEKDFLDAVVEMAACKAAIKAGDRLEEKQMRDLLRQGDELPTSYACPHGRPTTIRIQLADLEKWFRRRV